MSLIIASVEELTTISTGTEKDARTVSTNNNAETQWLSQL